VRRKPEAQEGRVTLVLTPAERDFLVRALQLSVGADAYLRTSEGNAVRVNLRDRIKRARIATWRRKRT